MFKAFFGAFFTVFFTVFFRLFLTLLIMSEAPCWAENEVTLSLDSPKPIVEALYFEDLDKKYSFEELHQLDQDSDKIGWKKTDKLNFGYVPSRIWLKFKVSNASNHNDWMLEQQFPLVQRVHVYIEKKEKIESHYAGRAWPFAERPVIHKNLLFPFKLQMSEQATVYMSYESAGPIMVQLRILSDRMIITESAMSHLVYGLYYGMLIAIVIYNFFIFIGTREKVYIFYVLYGLTFCLYHMCLSGIAYQYLWPKNVAWNHIAAFVLVPLSYVFVMLFTKFFLETKNKSKISDIILNIALGISVVLTILPIVHYDYRVSKIIGYALLSSSFMLFAVSIICYFSGVKNVKYFIISFAGVLVANSMYAARAIGLIRDTFLTNHGIQIASTAEVFLFSLALVDRIKFLQEERKIHAHVSKLAYDVSHNIESPIATLNTILSLLKDTDESVRVLLRYAINSISDLANQLLELRRITEVKGKYEADGINAVSIELIPSIVEQVVSLKKYEYNKYELIRCELPENDLFIFGKVNAANLRSIVSNLVNNSIEANAKNVLIGVTSTPNEIVISIQDNGFGMSKEVSASITEGTFRTKTPGRGLGLRHAVESLKSWNGEIKFFSTEGGGTTVNLTLPRVNIPSWFATSINLKRSAKVVAIDDDLSVHKIWDQRLINDVSDGKIELDHFSNGYEVRQKQREYLDKISIFLIDYEFLNGSLNGLDLIKELKIHDRSILVTSKWDEPMVVNRCKGLGVPLLPKVLAGRVPVSVV